MAIFDLQTTLEKFGSWLRKSVQVCAEIWHHVVDAEQAIQRIEQQLRAAAAVAGHVDLAARILSERQKAMESPLSPSPRVVHTWPARPWCQRSSEMLKPNSGQEATGRDLQQILGGLDDGTALTILPLQSRSSKKCE